MTIAFIKPLSQLFSTGTISQITEPDLTTLLTGLAHPSITDDQNSQTHWVISKRLLQIRQQLTSDREAIAAILATQPEIRQHWLAILSARVKEAGQLTDGDSLVQFVSRLNGAAHWVETAWDEASLKTTALSELERALWGVTAEQAQTTPVLIRVMAAASQLVAWQSDPLPKINATDSTVTETHIHKPTDSSLLWDGVRVMTRLLSQAKEMGLDFEYHNHHRVAKKRARSIIYTRGEDKKKVLYLDLIKYTKNTLEYIENAKIAGHVKQPENWVYWCTEVNYYLPLINQVIDQTTRRILDDEKVPASEKLYSLFEKHTDIIVKGNRDIQYGHKLNFSTGRSGMVLDVVIESGNPADSDQFIPMVDRHIENYGKAPRQAAADGGYASKENLKTAKQRDIKDVAFHKKRGLEILDMVKSPWVYRKLRNFRAGIEAGISYLKRSFGLSRCNWKGLDHLKTYVWSSVVTHNLVMLARLQNP